MVMPAVGRGSLGTWRTGAAQLARALAVLLLALLAQAAVAAAAPMLKDIRIEGDDKAVHIRMLADAAFSFDAQVRTAPLRLEILLPPLGNAARLTPPAAAGLVSAARLLRRADGRVLLELPLKAPAYIADARALPPADGRPARMELRLRRTDAATLARLLGEEVAQPRPKSTDKRHAAPADGKGGLAAVQRAYRRLIEEAAATPASIGDLIETLPLPFSEPAATQQQKGKSATRRNAAEPATPAVSTPVAARQGKPVIVIDPGHGGRDPGAVDATGRREKDIVLAFARTLRDELKKRGYRVVMTREDDRYLKLRERVEVARRHHASLFVSIHADKFRRRGVRGLGVYTLSEEASDAEAAALAHMENAADLIGAPSLDDVDEEVRGILVDLAQRETNANSHILATELVRALRPVTALRRRPVRSAAFRVLKAPEIPSVLVELGYMTNPQDVRNMLSRRWRQRVAARMAGTIERFLKTRLALR